MSQLNNKVALVTGGSTGIGFAAAQAFQQAGAKVGIVGNNVGRLKEAEDRLGSSTVSIQANVGALSDLDNMVEQVKNQLGKLDVLFVNAGVASFVPLAEVTEEHFDQIMNVNLKGAYFTVQKLLPYLNDNASIIFTGSIVDNKGFDASSVYAASKAGLRSLARTFTTELSSRGIRVNVISPGPIETPIFSKLGMSEEEMQQTAEGFASMVPLGRFGKAEEVAKLALFLAAEGTFITGSEYNIDGGLSEV